MTLCRKAVEKIERSHFLYIATFLFIITLITYGNIIFNQLFFDDEQFIYKNTYVQNFSVLKYFTESVTSGAGVISNYYRPLLLLSYGIEYKLFSNIPFIYHLDNLLLHAISGILLFLLLKKLLNNNLVSILSSALFIVHPIQTEAVSYASGRNDPLSAIFIFLTLILYLHNTNKSKIAGLLCFILALLSRESAIITPLLVILIDFYKTKTLSKSLSKIIPLFIIAIIYFALRLTLLNFQNTLNFYEIPTIYSTNIFYRFFTFLSVIPVYIGLIFFPKTLYIDRTADVVVNIFNPVLLITSASIIILFFLTIKLFKKNPIFFFSFFWFFVTISPASGLIPINGIIYEHFLYLPSIGIFIPFSYFLFLGIKKVKSNTLFTFIFFFIFCCLTLLALRTIARNKDWRDPITFYTQTIQNNPKSARLHNNLAMAFSDQGRISDAIREYKVSITIEDSYPQTHFNLANAYISLNKIEDAEKEYLKAISIDKTFIRAYLSLAQIYKYREDRKKLEDIKYQVELMKKTNPALEPLVTYLQSF